MSEHKKPFDKDRRDISTIKGLEEKIAADFNRLGELNSKIDVADRELKTALAEFRKQNPCPEKYDKSWYDKQEKDPVLLRAMRELIASKSEFANALASVMNEHRSVSEKIVLPDGEYSVEVIFKNRNGEEKKMNAGSHTERGVTLGRQISSAFSDISMLGIHNFGFRVPHESYGGAQVKYHLSGPDGFSLDSYCYINSSGHIVQSADQVR